MEILETIFFCGVDSEKYYFKISKSNRNNEFLYLLDNSDMEHNYFNNKDVAFYELFNNLQYLIKCQFDEIDDLNDKDEIEEYLFRIDIQYVDEEFFKNIQQYKIICLESNSKLFLLTNEIYKNYNNKLNFYTKRTS